MDYVGDVTLPDGRVVHGIVRMSQTDPTTGAADLLSVDLEWPDGTPLTDEDMHQEIKGNYLHEWVTDKLLATATPEYPDLGWED